VSTPLPFTVVVAFGVSAMYSQNSYNSGSYTPPQPEKKKKKMSAKKKGVAVFACRLLCGVCRVVFGRRLAGAAEVVHIIIIVHKLSLPPSIAFGISFIF